MTKEEALRLALSTLNEVQEETFRLVKNGEKLYSEEKVWDTIYEIKKVLKQALAQPSAWVGLSNEDMNDPRTHNLDFIDGARWAETKLKEKNDGVEKTRRGA